MFIAALAHMYSFPHKPFHINVPQYWTNPNTNWFNAFIAMWDISDVQQDVSEHLNVVSSTLTRPFRGRTNYHVVPQTSGYCNETDYLMPSTSTSEHYQATTTGNDKSISNSKITSKNRYGAIDNLTTTAPLYSNFGGISIMKKDIKNDASPHYGAPTSGRSYLTRNDERKRSRRDSGDAEESLGSNRNDTSSKSESVSINTVNVTKSDSSTSDWLSTPTDELLGIDVKGVERDNMVLLGNPKV